ncbi:hypothetical protein QBC34DRAFT_399763 [Podospora aff. communis PSN243]|uniref:J domain-containing protein n=1 Tax=Podospora aff. communis PSN243 TaxID=3040156 RepID=A0AAV9GW12_9PEZI|nr:hypothetical protein QBC34DRAFT_399763 [Podospora aff. communis PSN243]
MPLRIAPPLTTLLPRHPFQPSTPLITQRPFHATLSLHDDTDKKSHYETLNVHPDATPSEIKRSYFALSKAHHPDHNPSDPHASRRFMRISEAYSVLGHAEKRARYDRDVLRRPHAVPHRGHPKGSYHSGQSQAGGRPASGLSRRRGPFQGPPPSFFRSGGWGAHAERRRAAHEETTGTGSHGAKEGPGPQVGGMGPGQNPYRSRADRYNDVPHFDRESHERTHRRQEERRERRAQAAKGLDPFGTESASMAEFFIVTGIVVAAVLGPYLLVTWAAMGGKREKRRQKENT